MKTNIVDYFQFNLYRLKNWVNKNSKEDIDEITLIVFNNIIDHFPNEKWFSIKQNFMNSVDYQNPSWVVTYTIIAYNLGPSFVNSHPTFIEDLCTILTNYKISPQNLIKVARFFIKSELYETIITALSNKGIFPRYIFKLILENFDTTKLNREATEKIYQIIKKFVEGFSYKIFDGNYSFFNIYRSLKKLWDEYIILELPDMNFSYIELLLQFDELPDESKKEKIRHDFATIENKNTSIAEKMQDSITVIAHYSYDLPKYVPKKDLK